ncbi:MAG: hypothetical protein LBE13_03510 [Bacteroidales bacterium]|jgi:hypothetical protein|nr:hypothetical protein [Bacteroidales bacterium]
MSVILIIAFYYYIDKKVLMKHRVLQHDLWEFESGEKIRKGDFINTSYIIEFNDDTMIFDFGDNIGKDTLILVYQYFNTIAVKDPKTQKVGKYTMKGANWINYLFKRKKNKDVYHSTSSMNINKDDYSIEIIDTITYVHYNDEFKHNAIIDSVFVYKKVMELNNKKEYVVSSEIKYRIL